MAPKKKTAKNGFYFFILHLQQENHNRGNLISLETASVIANPIWTNMSPDERRPFVEKAKRTKGMKDDGDNTKKFTSLGKSFAMVDAEEREKAEFLNIMKATIQNTVANLNKETSLKEHKFFVCHVNYFYRTEDNECAPAEFALGVFNLANGFLDCLHFFVSSGKIPLGLKFNAIDWSNRTHNIPVNDSTWKIGLNDYYDMFVRVRSFIEKHCPGSSVPPIYTMFDSLNSNYSHTSVKCAFDRMCDAAREDSSLFRVYCLADLFYELRYKCSPSAISVPTVALMKNELERDIFSYAKDIGCFYHEEKDLSPHCSLSMVTRWIFTICDHCCKHLNIQLQLGFHVPREVDVDWRRANDYIKESENPRCNDSRKPLTIISTDHNKKQEKKKVLNRERESWRSPRESYNDKIGARFTSDLAAALPSGSSTSDDGYGYNDKIGARFTGDLAAALPSGSSTSDDGYGYTDDMSSRSTKGMSGAQASGSSANGDDEEWSVIKSRKSRPGGAGHGRERAVAGNSYNAAEKLVPISGRGRLLASAKFK